MPEEKMKSKTDLQIKLTPAPSMSRTGKMAHSAMHTDALVRSGIAALKTRSKGKEGSVTLAEIIDPSQLDSFGTAAPGEDGGRGKEICSSPRGHPELQNKLEEIVVSTRFSNFNTKMDIAEAVSPPQPKGEEPPPRATSPRGPRAPVVKCVPRPRVQNPSACFRTVDRFHESKFRMKAPPVGHYRPKFSAVDSDARVTRIRAAHKAPVKLVDETVEKKPTEQPPETPIVRPMTPPTQSQSKSLGASDLNNQESGVEGPIAPVPPPPLPPQEDTRSPQRVTAYSTWVDRRNASGTVSIKGSSMFVSSVKAAAERPPAPVTSPDKCYYPYNESACLRRDVPGVANDWAKGTSRRNRILFKGYSERSEAPDAVYGVSKDMPDGKGCKFVDQVSREKAATDAQQMVSRRSRAVNAAAAEGTLHKHPAAHVAYDTSMNEKFKYPRKEMLLSFSRSVSRDQCPTEVQRPRKPVDPVAPYEPSRPSIASPRGISFEHQQDRPEFLTRLPHDLEYNTGDPSHKKVPGADMNRTAGHDSLFVPSITMNCDYKPNYDTVRPKSQFSISLDKMLSREEARSGVAAKQPLDTFYKTDPCVTMMIGGTEDKVPFNSSRVKGNPMIHSHISREKRINVTTVKKVSPDKFYELSPPKGPPKGIDFKNTVPRDIRSCGRLLPMSPRQLLLNQRSPGFIYDPMPVEKHSPALAFSRLAR